MLKFRKNVYDLLEDVRVAMGTDPDPLWMLIFNTTDITYSAINFKDGNDLANYPLHNNMIGVCIILPEDLMKTLDHPNPGEICSTIHNWCTLYRQDPDKIYLTDFFPISEAEEVPILSPDSELPPASDIKHLNDLNSIDPQYFIHDVERSNHSEKLRCGNCKREGLPDCYAYNGSYIFFCYFCGQTLKIEEMP